MGTASRRRILAYSWRVLLTSEQIEEAGFS
jgi:hypothetical protein